jgi:membrane fusion protein (multidrug efflux system)
MIPMSTSVKHGYSAKTRMHFLVLFLFGSLLLSGCGSSTSAETKAPAAAPPPATVIVEAAKFKDVTEERTFTGRVEAVDTVQIRARVQGYLKKKSFVEGGEVKKGQVLFEIERDSFEITVRQAEASLASAKAALTLAQQTFNRNNKLVKQRTLAQASLDDAQSALLQAQANVQVREAELSSAKLNLGYTRITAPMNGLVGRTTYSVGNLVGPDSNALVTLVAQDPMYVSFPVPQWLMTEIRKTGRKTDGVYVSLELPDGSTYAHKGTIKFTNVQGNSTTDSVTVRASIPNPERLLIDQQLVQVSVIRKQPERKLVVSQAALLLDQQGTYVLAVDAEDKVVIKRITTGEQQGSLIVIDSGLEEGDKVIISGHQKAKPGGKVSPQMAEDQSGAVPTTGNIKSTKE